MKELILLHGALGASSQLANLKELLSKEFKVLTFNFSGHGGTLFKDSFGISTFISELADFVAENCKDKPAVIGYSMGGYVALCLEMLKPTFSTIVTLATKFDWTPENAQKEVKMLNPEVIIAKVPLFAETLEKRHDPNDWKRLMEKTAQMMIDLGNNPPLTIEGLQKIDIPVVCCVGDRDEMISLLETMNVAKKIPVGSLFVLPKHKHPIEKLNVKLFHEGINHILGL
jgi:pimeloyl-ACP methyl ester carboxylesterase